MIGARVRNAVSIGVAVAIAGALLYAALLGVDRWAARTFGWPLLAAMLVAVIDVALFVLALTLVSGVSRLVERLLGRLP